MHILQSPSTRKSQILLNKILRPPSVNLNFPIKQGLWHIQSNLDNLVMQPDTKFNSSNERKWITNEDFIEQVCMVDHTPYVEINIIRNQHLSSQANSPADLALVP